jgi:hypothetical protein
LRTNARVTPLQAVLRYRDLQVEDLFRRAKAILRTRPILSLLGWPPSAAMCSARRETLTASLWSSGSRSSRRLLSFSGSDAVKSASECFEGGVGIWMSFAMPMNARFFPPHAGFRVENRQGCAGAIVPDPAATKV